jgi:1,6-anhydro-N-acetylmuramate kinase
VAAHGQTVFHAPPVSWQMLNGPVLAHELGVPVVFDLRAADLAAGGQGAPITPLADWVMFRSEHPTAVVNLGGFCNITLLPAPLIVHYNTPRGTMRTNDFIGEAALVDGFDVCACNHLLDRVARDLLGCEFDQDGRASASGRVHEGALHELFGLLAAQSKEGRSLGTGDEAVAWINRWRTQASGEDLAASACAAIARTIASRLGDSREVLVAGGGARNAALLDAIRRNTKAAVNATEKRGVPIEFREAAAMAVLGAMCEDKVPITLARVTGVGARQEPTPIAGVWAGR